MQGFPPPKDAQVTLANWQAPPYSRWSFSHMRELVPTQRISRGTGPVTPLPADPRPLGGVPLRRVDGSEVVVDAVLEDLAGNSIERPFEVDVVRPVERSVTTRAVRLPFHPSGP